MAGNDFIDISVVGAEYAISRLNSIVVALPEMVARMPGDIGGSVMELAVMPEIRMRTPVDTGQLYAQTDWRIAEREEDQVKIEVFSTAQNVRTGYEYARARAYGFNHVPGDYFWVPPEDPPYPVQALQAAKGFMEMEIGRAAYRKTVDMIGAAA